MPNPQHDFADLGDVKLHYVTAGTGPAVVLLHGWPQTWVHVAQASSPLAAATGHWSRPLHGRSSDCW
jgi:pimeloyl-ACP methyl ester carboxylesterase